MHDNYALISVKLQVTKVSTLVWGNHPVSIRFIAFLAGNALIPLVYILCRTLKQSGVFASITLAVFPYFVLYFTNARGYTLVVLFTLSLALIGARIAKQLSISKTASFSLVAALGMLTMPTMLFPIAGIYLWVLLLLFISGHTQKRVFYEFALPSILITSTLTALFYTPVILVSNGIQSIIANRFVKAQPWQKFISQMYPHFNQTFIDFTRDIPDVLLLVATILFAIGLYSAVKPPCVRIDVASSEELS
ncbi:MAG: glycosyltransferase family 39 protein [Deltaproteobacteria bacterium]|nr:glycosyltransferase family 39 protein [Deltaproteobacteria bacterium]